MRILIPNLVNASTADFDEQRTVAANGTISLPYLGDFKIVGLTTQKASERITNAYNDVTFDSVDVQVSDVGR